LSGRGPPRRRFLQVGVFLIADRVEIQPADVAMARLAAMDFMTDESSTSARSYTGTLAGRPF
jgi:hypothetical protein